MLWGNISSSWTVRGNGKMDGATYSTILKENIIQTAEYLKLEQSFTFLEGGKCLPSSQKNNAMSLDQSIAMCRKDFVKFQS